MVKVLSQAGISLADVYDVEGSIAGVEQLQADEIQVVHEMGATIFSERLSGAIRRATTGAILQSTAWDIILVDLPNVPARVLGVFVFTDASARVSNVSVHIRNPLSGREIPIFAWDSNENTMAIRMDDNDTGPAAREFLATNMNVANMPSMLIGDRQPQSVQNIAFRGLTLAFGAGNVTVTALIYIAFTQIGGMGVSSYGLPIPSW